MKLNTAKNLQALALTTLFGASAAYANDNGTNGTIVCDETNSTNLVLVEVRTEPSTQPTLGSIYAEIDVMNVGPVPNVAPLTYNIYANDANGNRILPAVETKLNPFPIEPDQYTVRFFYTNQLSGAGIDSYTFEISYPCSTNEDDNTLVGPVPGTIRRDDTIFKDGFENQPASTTNLAVKTLGATVDGVDTYTAVAKKAAAPALKR